MSRKDWRGKRGVVYQDVSGSELGACSAKGSVDSGAVAEVEGEFKDASFRVGAEFGRGALVGLALRSMRTSAAPCSANTVATAWPMPVAEPVMMATLFVRIIKTRFSQTLSCRASRERVANGGLRAVFVNERRARQIGEATGY